MTQKYPVGTILKCLVDHGDYDEADNFIEGQCYTVIESVAYPNDDSYNFKEQDHDPGWVKHFIEKPSNFEVAKLTWKERYEVLNK